MFIADNVHISAVLRNDRVAVVLSRCVEHARDVFIRIANGPVIVDEVIVQKELGGVTYVRAGIVDISGTNLIGGKTSKKCKRQGCTNRNASCLQHVSSSRSLD